MECSKQVKTKLIEHEGGDEDKAESKPEYSQPELKPATLSEAEELGLDKLVKITSADKFYNVYQMDKFCPKGCLIMLLCDNFNAQSNFLEISLPYFFAQVTTIFIERFGDSPTLNDTQYKEKVDKYITGFCCVAAFVSVCAWIRYCIISTVSENLLQTMRQDLYANYKKKFSKLQADQIDFDESKKQFDLEKIDECLTAYQTDLEVHQPLKKKYFFKTLFGVFIMQYMDWRFALVLIGSFVFFYFCFSMLDTNERLGQNSLKDLRNVSNQLDHQQLFLDQDEKFKSENEKLLAYSKKAKYIAYFGQYFAVFLIYMVPIIYMAYVMYQHQKFLEATENPEFPTWSGNVTGLSIQQIFTFVLNAIQLGSTFDSLKSLFREEAQNKEKINQANEYLFTLIDLQPPLKK